MGHIKLGRLHGHTKNNIKKTEKTSLSVFTYYFFFFEKNTLNKDFIKILFLTARQEVNEKENKDAIQYYICKR